MYRQHVRSLVWVMSMAIPASAVQPQPVLRYVFDRGGSQRDLGTAPAANGTLANSATITSNSPLSRSCGSLDLTTSGSYLTTTTDVDKIDALSAMTATLWINLRAAPAKLDCVLSDRPVGIPPAGQGGWELRINSSGTPTAANFNLEFGVMESFGSYTNSSGAPFPSLNADNRWLFVALVYNASRQLWYYSGTETAATTEYLYYFPLNIPLRPNSTEFRIGSATSEPTVDRTPPAWIDDVRIYDRALTLAEIEQVRVSNLMSSATLAVPAFFGLGDLTGSGCSSSAQGLSADGTTVVGYGSTAAGIRGFRWRYNSMAALVDPSSGTNTTMALATSADGSFVAGYRDLGSSQNEALRWDAAGVGTPLGDLPGGVFYSYAYGISGDGGTVVGYGTYADPYLIQAFRFTTAMTPLGFLPGDNTSAAIGISRDGTVIVGGSGTSSTGQACYWRGGAPVPLGDLDGGTFNSSAWRISNDKQVIVGYGNSASGQEAAFWRAGRILGLGDLPGGSYQSLAYGVSASGSYIVGYGTVSGTPSNQAFIWDRQHGMRSLKSALETDYGLDLSGWNLTFAAAISDDGSVITGGGTNPAGNSEAWIARLPVPHAVADFDGDADVDQQDAERFAACVTGSTVLYTPATLPSGCQMTTDAMGLLPADFDWDYDVDQDDFGAFQICFGGSGNEPSLECRG